MMPAIGHGYDSHRFETGRPLFLGGVRIEHDRGLAGHSDADAVAHALTDAILGAALLGDIGTHFPPSEDRWRDADSLELLRTAVAMVSGRVLNADVTVICEEPKLGPYREQMQRNLYDVVAAPVSVKATTNEGMGWVGAGEGIACFAVALLDLE